MSRSRTVPRSVELSKNDSEFNSYIKKGVRWGDLPLHFQNKIGSEKIYSQTIIFFSFKHQLKWEKNLVSQIMTDEGQYYRKLIQHSITNNLMYPYHLIEKIQITPFQYYKRLISHVLHSRSSYDSIPNFTAVDCKRWIGVGRNKYIEINSKYKRKRLFSKSSKEFTKFLPKCPIRPQSDIKSWFSVCLFSKIKDKKKFNQLEKAEREIYQKLEKDGECPAYIFPYEPLHSLLAKGMIYSKIELTPSDRVRILPLENFVLNRNAENEFEYFLYKIFVSHDERNTIQELSELIRSSKNISKVLDVYSVYCRLGFAIKIPQEEKKQLETEKEKEENNEKEKEKEKEKESEKEKEKEREGNNENEKEEKNQKEKQTIRDEASLIDKSWEKYIEKEQKLLKKSEKNLENKNENENEKENNLQNETQNNENEENLNHRKKRIAFIFDSSLLAFLMMGNTSPKFMSIAVTLFEVGKLTDERIESFIQQLEKVQEPTEENKNNIEHLVSLKQTLTFFKSIKLKSIGGEKDLLIEGVDLIKLESLTSLDSETLHNLLITNYGILFSMIASDFVPKPSICNLRPTHFGPPIPEYNSPWFRLFIYQTVQDGPPTLFLKKGTRIKKLPKFLKKFETLTLMSFDRESVNYSSSNVLSYINSFLLDSPILIQALERSSGDLKECFIPFPLDTKAENEKQPQKENEYNESNLHLHPLVLKISENFKLQNSVGLIKLIYIQTSPNEDLKWLPIDIKFGIPLFDNALNKKILEKIEKNNLLNKEKINSFRNNSSDIMLDFSQFMEEGWLKNDFFSISNNSEKISEYEDRLFSTLSIIKTPMYNYQFVNNTMTKLSSSQLPFKM